MDSPTPYESIGAVLSRIGRQTGELSPSEKTSGCRGVGLEAAGS